MGRGIRSAALTVAAVAVLGVGAPGAQAHDGGWKPYRNGPSDYPAGTVCAFHLHVDVVEDLEETRTVSTFPDGSPHEVQFRGPLVLRYTNVDTGAAVQRDQSGRATLYHRPDGSMLWVVPRDSHISARIRPGDPYHASGDYLFSGGVVLLVHPDHNVQVLVRHRVENLCETLA